MIELRAGRLRCELKPELGGCIAGLWLEGEPVLRSTPAAQLASARQAGSYPLVPFSNRIGHASLVWQGTQHPLVRNNGDEPHAIHGVGWQRPWTVLDDDATSAMLSYEHRPDASWPFAFDCSHTLRLRPGALEMTLALTNQSEQPAPAGLGWHPYFVKRSGSRIAFEATGRWETGPDKLPTVRQPAQGLKADCGTLDVDHCYDGWNGLARLHDGRVKVTVRSGLTRLVVFTTPGRDHVAIEPVSHVNNAVHLYAQGAAAEELGLRILQPGETMVAQMAIEAEDAP
ncbi:aldose 1-epimerase [Ramlibacter monticola]|uniref:Aldose 1-epimerase n=1 Tax=Ramlibacter monticola TaxID=1926872 RepID=A0A937CT73_9BURK|nr:aldose 1-epimerase [Ramlibacter monticola]MBL0392235.1 aldose 1-epimerase [Ramlibacter monticola]